MKSYELYKEWKGPTAEHRTLTIRYTAVPDPKRPGMYKTQMANSVDGYDKKGSHLYGKKHQAYILEWIKEMDEIV